MCARTGWTWAYVWEEMDVDRIEALEKYWKREPPVDLLVAQFLGFKPKEDPIVPPSPKQPNAPASGDASGAQTDKDLRMQEVANMFSGGIIR